MVRTTIMLPAKLKAAAERLARKQGLSLGQFVRHSVEQNLASTGRPDDDPLLADDFVSHAPGPTDVAENHDKYLCERRLQEHRRGTRR